MLNDTRLLSIFTSRQAWHYRIIPFERTDKSLRCYVSDTTNADSSFRSEIEALCGYAIDLVPIADGKFVEILSQSYKKEEFRTQNAVMHLNNDSDFFATLVSEARAAGSSDIHIEPMETRARIRLRIDGMMIERYTIEKGEYSGIVNKIKIRANLDIAEKRLPQDGRVFFTDKQKNDKFDIRVSVLPTLHGEKIVMRLLQNDAGHYDISQLGFSADQLKDYLEAIKKPNGIILISGPTGSGKTTTLYATLRILNQTDRNIITIEDPIEYTIEGINQVQLRDDIGLDFAAAMRTFLRQDPDIIMVGEIRDQDTAAMAIRASLTGHLVFSTIHTNSAWGIIARLSDMGSPSYLLADTLNMVVAQRLVRLLCLECKQVKAFDPQALPRKFTPGRIPETSAHATGCPSCYYTGYKGRKAIYEVITIDAELADCIRNQQFNITEKLTARGVKTLSSSAYELMCSGETSIEEIYVML